MTWCFPLITPHNSSVSPAFPSKLGKGRYFVAPGLVLFLLASGCAKGAQRTGTPNLRTTVSVLEKTGTTTSQRVTYGIDINQFDQDIGPAKVRQVMTMASSIGARAIRIGASWSSSEPTPGTFNWRPLETIFQDANSLGLTVLLELGNEPTWDAIGGNTSSPPADCASLSSSCSAVTTYVSALVRQAKPLGLKYLIVRNEPQNFNKNWVGGSSDAFAHYQQVVYQTAHSADPQISILSGGTESASPTLIGLRNSLGPITPYENEASQFAQDLYLNPSWCNSIDILDIHVGDHGPVYSPQIVDSSESALESCNGNRHTPVWVTEVGYPSDASLQGSNVYQVELANKYTGGQAGQARFLSDTFRALSSDPNVIGVNWTFMIDPNPVNENVSNMSYNQSFSLGISAGLAYSNYQTKQAYNTFSLVAEYH